MCGCKSRIYLPGILKHTHTHTNRLGLCVCEHRFRLSAPTQIQRSQLICHSLMVNQWADWTTTYVLSLSLSLSLLPQEVQLALWDQDPGSLLRQPAKRVDDTWMSFGVFCRRFLFWRHLTLNCTYYLYIRIQLTISYVY